MDMEYGPYSDFDSGHARAAEANSARQNAFIQGQIHGKSLSGEFQKKYADEKERKSGYRAKYMDYQPVSDSKHYKGVDDE
jgi:hypothetical protein